jgi:hypothetical protein
MPARWFVDETDPAPVLKAIDEARRHLAQKLMLPAWPRAIEQYGEAATDNREYFLNQPHSGGSRKSGDVP